MDFQDILFFIVFLALTALPKKRKEKPEDTSTEFEATRKKIEALKKQRTQTLPKASHDTQKQPPKVIFSAYKHINHLEKKPCDTPSEPLPPTIPKTPCPSFVSKTSNGMQHPSIRTGMIGKIILDKPAFKKNYGNFIDR